MSAPSRSAACVACRTTSARSSACTSWPATRSRGTGHALLAALEDAARDLGCKLVRVDAGPQQKHSKRLFAASGYVEIGPYSGNHIADYFAEKRL